MKTLLLISLIVLVGLCSCKKDRLVDDKEILIGTWNWSHSYHEFNKCEQCCVEFDTISSLNYTDQFTIRFFKNGRLEFNQNEEIVKKYRIVFDDFVTVENDSYIYDIHLDGDFENVLSGRVNSDSLYTWDFPFNSDDQFCFTYQSYFMKQ